MDSRGAVILSEGSLDHRQMVRETTINTVLTSKTLAEGMEAVRALLNREDVHYSKLFGGTADDGMEIKDLQDWSRKIRPSMYGATWIGKGYRARANYIWQGGLKHGGTIPAESRGKGFNVQACIDDQRNQDAFFSPTARRKREGQLYSDGFAAWIGDEKTKILQPLPLSEITDILRDPSYAGRIWAYRRVWSEVDLSTGISEEFTRWYFVEKYVDKRVHKIRWGAEDEDVDQNNVVIDQHANPMEGFALGAPDALAAFVWNAIARDAYMDGVTMTSAMATFAFKASVSTPGGAAGAGMKIAGAEGAGQTAIVGATNELVPMGSAGKAYDFGALRGLTAIIAASLDISNTALTSDASDGGSYGSENALDMPTRLAMEARRLEHIELEERVLRWMGAKDATAYFDALRDASDVFREVQALLLLWSSGLFKPEPLAKRLSDLLQVVGNSVPGEVLIPNNANSWQRNDIDPANDPSAPNGSSGQTNAVGKPNATPAGQGQTSPVGKGKNANDLRTDKIGEMMRLLTDFIATEDRREAERRVQRAA